MPQMNQPLTLTEGITHIEDLSVPEFIRTVESLKDKIVTEKLDGANLWFGVDETGFYTSREGKSPKKGRFYSVSDYQNVAAYNGFRAAHLALEKVSDTIKTHLKPGGSVEIEVLYGRQPNTVTYGVQDKNFIVILRGVNDTPEDQVQALSKALNNKSVSVTSNVIASTDGDTLTSTDQTTAWEFTNVAPMDTKKVNLSDATERLSALKKFVASHNDLLDMTNGEVAELSLNSVPKEKREAAKAERERVAEYIMTEFKQPIKELLLNNFVRKIKPFLQAHDLDASEDIGVEGVVVRDPVSGAQTKIVDRDVFTAINKFNNIVRSEVSGLVKTTDQDAAAESRGGVFGQAKIRIAELMGARELALSSGTKKFVTKFKGASAAETAANMAASLNITSVGSTRTKVAAILQTAVKDVNAILDKFKNQSGAYRLTLKTGKEIGLSPEVMKRTLTAFAETKQDIKQITTAVLKSSTAADLVLALYGRTINSLFENDDVKEHMTFFKSVVATPVRESTKPAAKKAMSLLQSLQEDEGIPDGQAIGTITSGAISPLQTKLTASKNVQKRRRAFVKPKKFPMPESFSLIKSVNEDWAHVKDMQFATDVDDTAQAQNDIEFKQLRNNINVPGDEVTSADVSKYLDKAHNINDEVDSVTFGLEADDGQIVKVWVNASQADNFEAALADLLGKEDDLEKVINLMADTFDIVDVEWPGADNALDTAPDAGVDGEVPADDLSAVPSDEENVEIHLGTASDEEVAIDDTEEPAPDAESDSTDEPAPDEEPAPDDESVASDEDSPDEPPADGEAEEDDGEEDEIDEIDDETGEPKKKKKKKKPEPDNEQPTEESAMKTLGQQFKDKLLAEAAKKKQTSDEDKKPVTADAEDSAVLAARGKIEKQISDLMKVFPTAHEKAVVTMLVTLGAPISALKIHKAELRDAVQPVAEQYRKNSSFRMWANKLMGAIGDRESVAEDARFEKRLSNKYQRVIYHVLKKLGLPEAVERTASRALYNGIRSKSAFAIEDSNVRVYLMAVAEQLGVDENVRNDPDAKGVNEELITEDVGVAVTEVSVLLEILGFDVNSRIPLATQAERQPARNQLVKLSSNPSLLKLISTLSTRLEQKLGKAD